MTCWIAVLAMLWFVVPSTAVDAATLNVSGGQLLGASGVDVDGSLYDVAFLDGTCVALFDGCDEASDFTFQTNADASAASQALLDQVLLDGVDGTFDTDPELTTGCSDVNFCQIYTPYALSITTPGDVVANAAENTAVSDSLVTNSLDSTSDQTAASTRVWAVWTPVPEPSTALLFAGGLVALAWGRGGAHRTRSLRVDHAAAAVRQC